MLSQVQFLATVFAPDDITFLIFPIGRGSPQIQDRNGLPDSRFDRGRQKRRVGDLIGRGIFRFELGLTVPIKLGGGAPGRGRTSRAQPWAGSVVV